MLILRLILFTILVPGTVAGYIPYRLMHEVLRSWNKPELKWMGIGLIIIGITIYIICAISFLVKGLGTPSTWFTGPLKHVIGDEPKKLVAAGIYKYSRNPMYLGVVTVVLGEAFYFERLILFHYFIFLFILFHFVVITIEEPHLKKKYGEEYIEYKKKTRRWF